MTLEQRLTVALAASLLVLGMTGCERQDRADATDSQGAAQTEGAQSGEAGDETNAPGKTTYFGTGEGTEDKSTTGAQSPQSKPTAASGEAMSPGAFIQRAAQANMLEVQTGRLAREKAASDEVRKLADTMIEEHSAANARLGKLAKQKGVQMPSSLDRQGKAMMRELNELDGAEFERAYSQELLKAHQQTVQLFEDAAEAAQDPEVQSFAQSQLPTLRKHLKMAQSLPEAGRG